MSDDVSFESIHDLYRPRVRRYLSRLAGEAESEDLTQLVMLKVSHGLRHFRGQSTLATWIYRIATNAAMDALRRKPPALQDDLRDLEEVPEAQVESLETSAVREEMISCIREFIEHLPPDYKTVMWLSEIEGFKDAEIATILGASLHAVKIRLHRARAKLRNELETGCIFYRCEGEGLACDRKPVALPRTVSISAPVSSNRCNHSNGGEHERAHQRLQPGGTRR